MKEKHGDIVSQGARSGEVASWEVVPRTAETQETEAVRFCLSPGDSDRLHFTLSWEGRGLGASCLNA